MPVTCSSHSSCLRARESLTKKKMKRDSFASNEKHRVARFPHGSPPRDGATGNNGDRKSTRLNSSHG